MSKPWRERIPAFPWDRSHRWSALLRTAFGLPRSFEAHRDPSSPKHPVTSTQLSSARSSSSRSSRERAAPARASLSDAFTQPLMTLFLRRFLKCDPFALLESSRQAAPAPRGLLRSHLAEGKERPEMDPSPRAPALGLEGVDRPGRGEPGRSAAPGKAHQHRLRNVVLLVA
jgi:hypothetical protein